MSLTILQAALSIIELLPSLSKKFESWFDTKSVNPISKVLVELAKYITNSKDEKTAIENLHKNPALIKNLQDAIIKYEKDIEIAILQDKQNAGTRDINFINNKQWNIRADIMVLMAVLGLTLCLVLITFFRNTLPAEVLGAITTVAGIFGSCLKDAYNFEFGSSYKNPFEFLFKK